MPHPIGPVSVIRPHSTPEACRKVAGGKRQRRAATGSGVVVVFDPGGVAGIQHTSESYLTYSSYSSYLTYPSYVTYPPRNTLGGQALSTFVHDHS